MPIFGGLRAIAWAVLGIATTDLIETIHTTNGREMRGCTINAVRQVDLRKD